MLTEKILNSIVKRVTIDENRKVYLDGSLYGSEYNTTYTTMPSNKMLFEKLQSLLYNEFYAGINTKKFTENEDYIKMQEEVLAFNNNLTTANLGEDKMDKDWTIEQIDTNGAIYATKGNYKRKVATGEFLNETSFGRNSGIGDGIKLLTRKEFASTQSGFYFVFGKTITDSNEDMLVRFYFNITENGITLLIKNIIEKLNQFSVPFTFKCANHSSFYSRKDTAVLYIEKKYVSIFQKLLAQFLPLLLPFLQNEIPAFTKPITKGIGFAENPQNQDESFGTHCCKMITQGILSAYHQGVSNNGWLAAILTTIKQKHGYNDVNTLYLNVNSHYPYNFN